MSTSRGTRAEQRQPHAAEEQLEIGPATLFRKLKRYGDGPCPAAVADAWARSPSSSRASDVAVAVPCDASLHQIEITIANSHDVPSLGVRVVGSDHRSADAPACLELRVAVSADAVPSRGVLQHRCVVDAFGLCGARPSFAVRMSDAAARQREPPRAVPATPRLSHRCQKCRASPPGRYAPVLRPA